MSFHIRRMTPNSRGKLNKILPEVTPKLARKNPSYIQSRTPATSDESSESTELKAKMSLQTILQKKSTFLQELNISSTSWCLYDSHQGKFIGFREKHQRQIASLTKIMTTILCIEFFLDNQVHENFYVKITDSAAKMIGTTAELKVGTWIKVWDLLYGTMLPSGNDAAFLLSEVVGYLSKLDQSEIKEMKTLDLTQQNTILYTAAFIRLMNKKAEDLSLKDTTFSNPHGLQNAMNTSSPRDILNLSIYASKNQHFRKVMNTDTTRYYYLEQKKDIPLFSSPEQIIENYTKPQRRRWWNTNVLLNKGWEGIKTGQTGAAGSCLSSLKKGIYIVVLNCADNQTRFTETEKIYDWYVAKAKRKSTEHS